MIAPAALRNQYSHLYGSNMLPVLEEIFRSELDLHPSRREAVFKIVSHDRDIWQATEMHDLEMFSQLEEGEEYSFQRAKQGASKTLTIKKMGLGFSISEEAVADGKFDMIGDMVRKLAKSAKESQEVDAMNVLTNGLPSGSENTADGVTIFNSAHTLPSGLTFRNVLSTASDLSATSLEQALIDFETVFVGDSGIVYNIKPRTLLVHPNNKRYAMELIGSDLKADTSDNNMNSLKGDGLTVLSSPHLTDTDAWFLLASPAETGLRIISRTPIETKAAGPDVGFATDAILYKSRYREQLGCTHPYGVFATPGA